MGMLTNEQGDAIRNAYHLAGVSPPTFTDQCSRIAHTSAATATQSSSLSGIFFLRLAINLASTAARAKEGNIVARVTGIVAGAILNAALA